MRSRAGPRKTSTGGPAEAEIRWLDHCEARVARAAARRQAAPADPAPAAPVGRATERGR